MTSTQTPDNAHTMVQQWREQILNNLSWALVVLGGIALIIGSWADYSAAGERALPYIGIYFLTYLSIVVISLVRRLQAKVRALLLLLVLGAIATFLLVTFGLVGSGRILWLGVNVLALIYFDRLGSIVALIFSLIVMMITAVIYVTGNASFVTPETLAVQDTIEDWAGSIGLYLAINMLTLIPFRYLLQRLEGLAQQATTEAARARLHAQQVEVHAQELEQQTAQLQRTEHMLRNVVQSLETPTVEIADQVLLAPIVGQIDHQRADTLLKRLLSVVSERRVKLIVIDVAGVPAFDTMAAQSLMQTVQALRLIGCEAVITGISPAMAQTITALGIDMKTIATARSPQDVLLRNMM
ncbi:STAS domain-containing protein [Chloroflexus sp.]|uniref:STAS domain-containing protein n=1 Tax=Chloroflexus sp. TaxID=1904827 RepID=UPI00257AC9A0|nr:STAS domain-containing protein [Chloroflexus sp.]